MDTFDTPEEEKTWRGRNTIVLCMENMINLTRNVRQFKDIVQLKKDIGNLYFQQEYSTLRFQVPRQTGHTTACFELLRTNVSSVMVVRNSNMKKYWIRLEPKLEKRIFTTGEFIKPTPHGQKPLDVELVIVDNASNIKEIEDVIVKCSEMSNPICLLVQ